MNWKISLDKYLTTPPDDDFTPYCEAVIDELSHTFLDCNEDWIFDNNGKCNDLFGKLFRKGYEPKLSARIIERYHSIFEQ